MEEECLLKERLQAITDKKRIREDISRKRRDIEEEKVKLQYIKKKSLREQWLMDGLQSEEERKAMKIQAQDEVQRTAHLQSNILRMEEEMFALEQQELQLSANEEAILKRLRQVERTTEDIIKELSAQPLSDVLWPSLCPRHGGDSISDIFVEPSINGHAAQGHCPLESKRATFAMEISVELDKRTGKTQVISTASVTPETIHEKGLKVYEDSRKSVFALPPGETARVVTEMTPTDVDELLRQATHWSGGIQYHQPVHAAPFTGTSSPRPIQNKEIRTLYPSPSRSESRLEVYAEIESTINIEANTHHISNSNTQVADDVKDSSYSMFGSTSSPVHNHEFSLDFAQTNSRFLHCIPNINDLISEDISGPIQPLWIDEKNEYGQRKTPSPAISEHTLIKNDKMRQNTMDNQKAILVSVGESSDGVPTPTQLFCKTIEISSLSPQEYGLDTDESHFDHSSPSLDRANRVLEELSPGAVTLVFMGYENMVEDEDDPIQAELVMVGNSEEENSSDEDVFSVYHPNGCTSKVLQPQVGIAKVTDGRYFNEELEGGESLLHKPTFKHRAIKNASKSKDVMVQGCDKDL